MFSSNIIYFNNALYTIELRDPMLKDIQFQKDGRA